MATSLATSRELHEKFNFRVTIDGFATTFFQKCSELSREVAQIDYYEGGALISEKWPGRVTISDVTLERGVSTGDNSFDLWSRQVADPSLAGGIGAGLPPTGFVRGATIVQQDRPKVGFLRKWNLRGCWPKKYVAGEWDNTVDEVVIESLTLAIEDFQMALVGQPPARGGGP